MFKPRQAYESGRDHMQEEQVSLCATYMQIVFVCGNNGCSVCLLVNTVLISLMIL